MHFDVDNNVLIYKNGWRQRPAAIVILFCCRSVGVFCLRFAATATAVMALLSTPAAGCDVISRAPCGKWQLASCRTDGRYVVFFFPDRNCFLHSSAAAGRSAILRILVRKKRKNCFPINFFFYWPFCLCISVILIPLPFAVAVN